MKICYVERRFSGESKKIIDQANKIFDDYIAAGYILTLRQLFYQFVSRGFIPNTVQSYKRLGSVINDARLAGLIDWDLMEDRTRSLKTQPSWESPARIISVYARTFRIDKWKGQPCRCECWIEKDALAGVFERVCKELQVPYFSCRGYTSQSEMWVAGQRLQQHIDNGQTPVIFHFGDHDPSGIDMTRDIIDRLKMFMGGVDLKRLALNMDQVEEYNPPPNPAKLSDSRAEVYVKTHGDESWELDALQPDVLADLLRQQVLACREQDLWDAAIEEEEQHRDKLARLSDEWDKIVESW